MRYIKDHLAKYYVNNGGIFLLGRSFGSAVAAEAFYNDRYNNMIDGLILENAFTSIADLVDHNFPFLRYAKSLFLTLEWKTIDIISKIDIPMFFVAGYRDQIVPSSMTTKLYETATVSTFKEI